MSDPAQTAAAPKQMGNLAARLLTAVLVVPILLVAISWSNPLGVWLAATTALGLGLREFYRMLVPEGGAGELGVAVALGLGLSIATYWLPAPVLPPALAALVMVTLLWLLFRFGEVESVARRFTAIVAGALYVGMLGFLSLLKRDLPDGGAWVYVTLTCTWFSDTGAYFAGRFLGRLWPAKLYPSVSPKKTVIGALGGLAFSVGALVLAKLWYLPALTWTDCLLVAVPANLLAQTGDLCESLLKRSVGVKDSGALLPGHGGMLDRVDAVLFVVPYVYAYARFLK